MRAFTPSPSLSTLTQRLCDLSVKQLWSPYGTLPFPERLEPDALCFSPELGSLWGDPAYAAADEAQRRRLSFFEAVNFFSLNIHGEKSLLQGLALRLYESEHPELSGYLHHFLDEENKHMVLFGTFCTRYAGKIYPDRKLSFPRSYEPGEEALLFFAQVMVFEEVVDVYNRQMAKDERLHPLVRAINDYHHRDEVRHLAFGRQVVQELWAKHSPAWSADTVARVRSSVLGFLTLAWREYYNPDVYADAGFEDPYGLAARAFASPSGLAHRQRVSGECLRHLQSAGILEEASLP